MPDAAGGHVSNDVFGYVQPFPAPAAYAKLMEYVTGVGVGLIRIDRKALFNFPDEALPDGDCFAFLVGDRPDYPNATYLIDYCEYDPDDFNIGFPPDPKARLKLLLDVLSNIFSLVNPDRMFVAISDSSQIETFRKIKIHEIHEEIGHDFEIHDGPPDTLYEMVR
ncbi:MAG: hypothetical protein ABN482_10760 [Corticimicrobacter sp.]|uniref:hypothetical protein n=1 Tax=Corticimicrobacter sp. TaxID=2678536 RepID=UPI0032D9E2CE